MLTPQRGKEGKDAACADKENEIAKCLYANLNY
jgi:hypothetical protein